MAQERRPWQVRVRWLVWRPPWRRSARDWWTDALVPLELFRQHAMPDLVAVTIGLVLSVCVLLAGVVASFADVVATTVAVTVSFVEHVVLRRPFLVEATSREAGWQGWWVTGWRHARRVRGRADAALTSGRPMDLRGERGHVVAFGPGSQL